MARMPVYTALAPIPGLPDFACDNFRSALAMTDIAAVTLRRNNKARGWKMLRIGSVLKLSGFLFAFTISGIAAMNDLAAQSGNLYGAIAFSQSTGAHGYSYDYESRRSAERRALRECRQHGGGCKVATWFRNACGALAVGNRQGWGASWGDTRRQARREARRICRGYTGGCEIVRTVCTNNN